MAATSLEYKSRTISAAGGTVGLNIVSAKCGGEMKVYSKFTGAPAGATVEITYTLGSATPVTHTLAVNGANYWVATTNLDCGAPIPAVTYKVGANSVDTFVLGKVTY